MENIEQVQNEEQPIIQAAPEENILDNIKAGKVDFYSLPREEKNKIAKEAYDNLPDDEAKEVWDIYGWRPKELFLGKNKDGSPKQWVDYKDFKQKIETIAPIKNERIRDLAKERDSVRDENAELKVQMKKLLELNKAKFERELSSEEAAIDKEIQEAEEYNDVAKFKEASSKKNGIEREKLRLKTFEEPPVEPQAPEAVRPLAPEVSEWVARNDWVVKDPVLHHYAKAQDVVFAKEFPHLSLSERLKMVEDDVKTRFADKFLYERKTPAVDSARNAANFGQKPKVKSFDDLPDVEKKQADYLIKRGAFKSRQDFLKTYEWK